MVALRRGRARKALGPYPDGTWRRYRRPMTGSANDRAGGGPELPNRPEPRPAGLPLRELLELGVLAGSTVLAGASGLGRVVSRVNVMEVPDVLPYVRVDELLLTTGYALRDDPERLTELVRELHARDVAALGVKIGRYVDELPASSLRLADDLGFPVVRLPHAASYDELLTQVLTAVLDHQAERLTRSEDAHRALVQVVLDGGGLAEVAAALARILGVVVLLTDADGRLVAEADAGADLPAARATLVGADGVVGSSSATAVVRVLAGAQDHGRIIAFSTRRPLGDGDVQALERAATVCALVIAKQQAVSAVESRYQADFLRDLLLGRAGGSERTVPHARGLGWDLDRPLLVVVVEPDPVAPGATDLRPRLERLTSAWSSVVRGRDPRAAVVGFSTEVVAVLGLPDGGDGGVDRLVAELVSGVRSESGRRPSSVGTSRSTSGVDGLPLAYDQARTALQVGRQVHGPGAVAAFERLGLHRLLSLVSNPADLVAFEREMLGELAGEGVEAADLRHTLQVLLDTNLNVAQTSRALHFHYNTLRYRISKLERMLGPFTQDPVLRLDLAVALRVVAMRGMRR